MYEFKKKIDDFKKLYKITIKRIKSEYIEYENNIKLLF